MHITRDSPGLTTTPLSVEASRPRLASLYVHVPFCQTICGYCDFYSVVSDQAAVSPRVDALVVDRGGYGGRCERP